MATLRDGLGFDELNDDSDTAQKTAQLNITGSVTAGAQVSGLNLFAAGSAMGGTVRDSLGRIRSAVRSHAGSDYGLFVQAGSVATAAGSGGTIEFVESFASANYLLTLTPHNFANGAGSVVPFVSGTRNTSGCEVVGAASTVYNYVAVGL